MFIWYAADDWLDFSSGGEYGTPYGLNNRGVVSGSREFELVYSGFIYDSVARSRRIVDYPGAARTFLYGINDLDQVVGTWESPAGDMNAFIRNADGSYEELVPPVPGELEPYDINDFGQIAGRFYAAGENIFYGFLATPVPEPSSLVLLALGAGMLVTFRRREPPSRNR